MVAVTPIDPDQIQPWNPLSHLVDRKGEPLCSLHIQEYLLLWPPRAPLIKVTLAFIRNFLRRYRETGDIAAKPQRGARRSKIKGKDEELLQKLVKDQNDIDLRELQGSLLDRTGLEVSESSLCRQLNRLKLGRQKKFNSQLTALWKSSKAAVWMEDLARYYRCKKHCINRWDWCTSSRRCEGMADVKEENESMMSDQEIRKKRSL